MGKSTLIEIIVLGITGVSIKNSNKPDIINYGKKNGFIKIKFKVNNDEYEIERKYKKDSDKKATEAIKITKNGNDISGTINDTKRYIESNIITCDDILLTSIIKQNRSESFLLSNNRLGLLLKYAGINIFNEMDAELRRSPYSKELVMQSYLLKATKI
jgi:DNA repair exonuclease SbcCD ATPase subunit